MKNKIFNFTIILVLVMILLLPIVIADEFGIGLSDEITISSIDPSRYYDSKPCIWGDYVVWRRAINQNGNSVIELSEPSWIMLHNYNTGKTLNITAENKQFEEGIYYHAQSPDIWNGKIIYEAQGSANSYDTRLYMYNITSKDTWEIPLKSSEYSHGHLHLIYNDWIVYTNIENDKRQAYLYNYVDGIYRTIVGKGENYTVYGLAMDSKNIVISCLNETNVYSIKIYNIFTTITESVNYTGNYSKIIGTSVYNGNVAISVYEENQWNTYLYNINQREFAVKYENTYGMLIWDNNVVYKSNNTIYFETLDNKTAIPLGNNQYIGDIYGDVIVWMSNENSGVFTGDARDDFDIYIRTVLPSEDIIKSNLVFLIIIGIIIVVIVVVRRSNFSGMS